MRSDDDELFGDEDIDEHEGDAADAAAVIRCPYCAEEVEITLDPGGGTDQEYVEDCEVCCRPWQVFVVYDNDQRYVDVSRGDGSE
jgi:hypothetical protein